jgi:hypothetical protein
MAGSLGLHPATGELTSAEHTAAADFVKSRFGIADFLNRR